MRASGPSFAQHRRTMRISQSRHDGAAAFRPCPGRSARRESVALSAGLQCAWTEQPPSALWRISLADSYRAPFHFKSITQCFQNRKGRKWDNERCCRICSNDPRAWVDTWGKCGNPPWNQALETSSTNGGGFRDLPSPATAAANPGATTTIRRSRVSTGNPSRRWAGTRRDRRKSARGRSCVHSGG